VFSFSVRAVHAQELNVKAAFSFEHHARNPHSSFQRGAPFMPGEHLRTRSDLELRLRWQGLFVQSTFRLASGEKDRSLVYTNDLNQLHYDSAPGGSLGWSLGKKILTWGVGFGFRPLDVIQREDVRAINRPALVGLPLLSLEHFGANDALTLVWVNPAQGRATADRKDEALALRYFRFAGEDDLHVVARISRTRKLELGIGATHVVNDELSLYGGVLYAHRYPVLQPAIPLCGQAQGENCRPADGNSADHGTRAVAGVQWTGEAGWSLLAEAQYDGEAYARKDWQKLLAYTQKQLLHSAMFPDILAASLAKSSQVYRQTNLMRENVLLRISHDDSHGFKPYFEWFFAPRDRGTVITLGFEHERNQQRISMGLRHFDGPSDSAYANAPEHNVAWLRWESAF
jgi:hypothetical protein